MQDSGRQHAREIDGACPMPDHGRTVDEARMPGPPQAWRLLADFLYLWGFCGRTACRKAYRWNHSPWWPMP